MKYDYEICRNCDGESQKQIAELQEKLGLWEKIIDRDKEQLMLRDKLIDAQKDTIHRRNLQIAELKKKYEKERSDGLSMAAFIGRKGFTLQEVGIR